MYIRRANHLRLGYFLRKAVLPQILYFAVGLLILSLVATIVVGIFFDVNNQSSTMRLKFAQAVLSDPPKAADLSPATIAKRKQLAKDLIKYEAQNVKFNNSLFTKYENGQLRYTAKTGKPMKLSFRMWKKSSYYELVYGYIGITVMWLILGGMTLRSYNELRDYGYHRYADLPWNKAWPWIFTILLGPVWWVVMAISSLRLRGDEPLGPMPAIAEDDSLKFQVGRWTTYGYKVNDKALERYVELRTVGEAAFKKRRIEQLKNVIESKTQLLRKEGENLKKAREVISKKKAELRELEITQSSEYSLVSSSIAEDEFSKISDVKDVIGIRVEGTGIVVYIRAIIEYEGKHYYIGDFQTEIGPEIDYPEALCIVSGVRSDFGRGYPVYEQEWGFCFGSRTSLIGDYMKASQYFEAITLIIDCIRSVNERERFRIPDAFLEVTDEEFARAYI